MNDMRHTTNLKLMKNWKHLFLKGYMVKPATPFIIKPELNLIQSGGELFTNDIVCLVNSTGT